MNDELEVCAPGRKNRNNNSCFRKQEIIEMAKAYNRYITKKTFAPKNNYDKKYDLINVNKPANEIWIDLKKRFKRQCESKNMSICISKQAFMKELINEMYDDIMNNTFKPSGPKGSTEWLTTTHINDILNQYQEPVYPKHKTFGAHPRDYIKLPGCELLDIEKYIEQGKEYFSIVFNCDPHNKGGSHWVALFYDTTEPSINFCDSGGNDPIYEMNDAITFLKKFHKEYYGEEPTYRINKNHFQLDSTECGVYSCNFIIRMLAGQKFVNIIHSPLLFKQINSCRAEYFSNFSGRVKPYKMCNPDAI